jgi:hypothetical protein
MAMHGGERRATASHDGRCMDATSDFVRGLKLLTLIQSRIADYAARSSRGLIERFDAWFGEHDRSTGRLFLVTHGYSRTVREVLTRHRDEWIANGRFPWRPPDTSLFLLVDDSTDAIDTRIMAYEVKAPLTSMPFAGVAAGDARLLGGMVGENDFVVILLGIECFDENGWALHPRGLGAHLDGIMTELTRLQRKFVVIAVAQDYKLQRGFLGAPELFEDHFDRVGLYPPGRINFVVTENRVWPFPRVG